MISNTRNLSRYRTYSGLDLTLRQVAIAGNNYPKDTPPNPLNTTFDYISTTIQFF
ncbi:MAG: hypothetical protein JRE47_04170 [Deltaproteobacteria bacterium]|nr:hypothetical protein [Deltaproteobacteria bacterium]